MSAFFTRRMASPGKALPFPQRFAHVGAEGIQKILDHPLVSCFDLRRHRHARNERCPSVLDDEAVPVCREENPINQSALPFP